MSSPPSVVDRTCRSSRSTPARRAIGQKKDQSGIFSYYNKHVEFHDSARKHGVADQDIENLAAEAEAGYDVEALIARRNKRGRPTLGNAPASVESVRLDPELRRQLLDRAEADGTTTSELIREALRRYLRAA
jgi:predicted transcriptional regulator